MERWDLYKKDGTLAGIDHTRGEPIPEGLFHIVSGVAVRHVDGTYLLIEDGRTTLWGEAYRLSDGKMEQISALGDVMTLEG